MNVTIFRRAFWLIAVIALGYATFAFLEWRPTELLISAGLFVICIPVDMLLAREEREHRARARTPFGPLQRWGTRTYRSSSPFWVLDTAPPPVTTSSVSTPPIARQVVAGGRRRTPWWRRLYRRVTPWWVAAWSPLLLLLSIPIAPDAEALVLYPRITITVEWTGAPECINAHGPDGAGGLETIAICTPSQWWTQSYRAPRSGQWVGVDPEMSGADTLTCTLAVNGDVVVTESAVKGDGHEVTCLGRWS